jgi:hypothetical protein
MILITLGTSNFSIELIKTLNSQNFNNNFIVVDAASDISRLEGMKYEKAILRTDLDAWLLANNEELEFVIDNQHEDALTKMFWQFGIDNQVPLIVSGASDMIQSWAKGQEKSPFFWAMYPNDTPDHDGLIQVMMEREGSGVY